MKIILQKVENRGYAIHGWLDSYHSFSFANYYDPAKVHFGAIRVFNDDTVKPGFGFPSHPHENMEIVSIPLFGDPEYIKAILNSEILVINVPMKTEGK